MAERATLGGGCFWCLEAAYQLVRGVRSVTPGYAGGQLKSPRYEQVVAGTTGHAEVVQVEFDPAEISYAQVLEIFWALHDPTTPNRQGFDVGPQYRSIILYENEGQRQIAEQSRAGVQPLWPARVVTEIVPLKAFHQAEEEHRDYFRRNPGRAYCQVVINPKLEKLRDQYRALIAS